MKGISAAAEVVKPGGHIICVAECRDGLPDHGAYAAILAEKDSPGELLEMINSPGYSVPDQWQVQIQAQIQMKSTVSVVAGCLDPEQIRAAHFEPAEDAGEAAFASTWPPPVLARPYASCHRAHRRSPTSPGVRNSSLNSHMAHCLGRKARLRGGRS